MNDFRHWLSAGCVVAATALVAAPAFAQSSTSRQSDNQYPTRSQEVDRDYRSESRDYDTSRDYDPRTRTYRSGAGQQSVSGTQQWYPDPQQPTPRQYRASDNYRTYDAGVYRDTGDRDRPFRSSAGTQSPSSTERRYGRSDYEDYDDLTERDRMMHEQQARQSRYRDDAYDSDAYGDYDVYGTERDQQRWQREDQAQYDRRYDTRDTTRYEQSPQYRTDERYSYERQRIQTDRDRDVDVYYRDRGQDRPVPFRYDERTTTPRQYEDRSGIELRDRDGEIYFRPDDFDSRETRTYRIERDSRSSADAVQPRQYEFRTDGGWYYDEDNRVWVRVPGYDQSRQRVIQRERD